MKSRNSGFETPNPLTDPRCHEFDVVLVDVRAGVDVAIA
jgi:hypothetical protein